jgi:hypothetical protein
MRNLLLLATIATLLASVVLAEDSDPLGLKGRPLKWTYCDEDEASKYALQITDFKLEPNPPRKGEKVKVQVKGKLASEITAGAKVTYSVKFGLIQLTKKTADLCELLSKIKDKDVPKCPVKAGELAVVREQEFPSEAPAGKYTIEAEAVAADGKTTILCVKADLTMPLISK